MSKPLKNGEFKQKHGLDDRKTASATVLTKFPTQIPCIIEVNETLKDLKVFNTKWCVRDDYTITALMMQIRERYIDITASDGIFIFVKNNTICRPTDTLRNLYDKYKDEDGFLYMIISRENVFG